MEEGATASGTGGGGGQAEGRCEKSPRKKCARHPPSPRPRIPGAWLLEDGIWPRGRGWATAALSAKPRWREVRRGGKKAKNLRTTENQQTRSNAYSLFLHLCACVSPFVKRSDLVFSPFFAISQLSANTRTYLWTTNWKSFLISIIEMPNRYYHRGSGSVSVLFAYLLPRSFPCRFSSANPLFIFPFFRCS